MTPIIRELLALYEIDRSILTAKERHHEAARAVLEQEKVRDATRADRQRAEEAIREQAMATDRVNLEIRAAEAEAKDQESRVKTIKNQREYRIITDRIKELKQLLGRHEETILEAMENLDRLRQHLARSEEAARAAEVELERLKAEAAQAQQAVRADLEALKTRRDAQIAAVRETDENAYAAYDQALKRTRGDAMARLSVATGVCESCSRRQNSNVINQILIGKDIRTCRCQGCGRLLYADQPA